MTSIECTRCGTVVPEGASFCSECGSKVVAPVNGPQICEDCGDEIPASAKFCPGCGSAAATSSVEDSRHRAGNELRKHAGNMRDQLNASLEQIKAELADELDQLTDPGAPAQRASDTAPTAQPSISTPTPAKKDDPGPIGKVAIPTNQPPNAPPSIAPIAHASARLLLGGGEEPLTVEVDHLSWLNYALFHANVSPIRSVAVTNNSSQALSNPVIEIGVAPSEYGETWQQSMGRLDPLDLWQECDIRLPLSRDRLKRVIENERATLKVTVTDGGKLLAAQTTDIDIQPFNHWMFMYENLQFLAAFVTPNRPVLSDVIAEAAHLLKKRTGDASFAGYQYKDPDRVRQMVAALHDALALRQIEYINPPAVGLESGGQKIRSVDDTIQGGRGTCLDLSVLLLSLMEQVGLNPMMVLVPGHAFLGCFTTDSTLPGRSFEDVIAGGWAASLLDESSPILIFNSVTLCSGGLYEAAVREGVSYINATINQGGYIYLVDINSCRQEGVTPLS